LLFWVETPQRLGGVKKIEAIIKPFRMDQVREALTSSNLIASIFFISSLRSNIPNVQLLVPLFVL
jgi:hypothetical protein